MAKGGSIKCEECGKFFHVNRYDNPDRICDCGWQPPEWYKARGRIEGGELVIAGGYKLRAIFKWLGFRFDADRREWRGEDTEQARHLLRHAVRFAEENVA